MAISVQDPAEEPPWRSRDPGDDYLLALAVVATAVLVTGDSDLLADEGLPIYTAAEFLKLLTLA